MSRRAVTVLTALVLVTAACRPADEAAPVTTGAPPSTTTTTTTTATDPVGEDDHDHGVGRDWDGQGTPTIGIAVTTDGAGGWTVELSVTDFEMLDSPTDEHVPGQGHAHVTVDGRVVSMVFGPTYHLGPLPPGDHTIGVYLSANDHVDYLLNETRLEASTTITVGGESDAPDVAVSVEYAGGEVAAVDPDVQASVGDTVEITVTSDVAEELHVHGYDLVLNLDPGVPSTARFTADIPGIFEVELEKARLPILELTVK